MLLRIASAFHTMNNVTSLAIGMFVTVKTFGMFAGSRVTKMILGITHVCGYGYGCMSVYV